ncbi:MAG TPA: alpha-E domain-containing protein [Bryobacteraceae bacterium]|nr:alpha-E domain-containing protein [Bryobacteraceae bacterium]
MRAASQPLLSRVADSIYWMGRYIERAENVARFLGVNQNLMLDLPREYGGQWEPIVDTSGDRAIFHEHYGAGTEENVVQFLAFDLRNRNSICSCVLAARENARSVRETISSEMWEQINSLYLLVMEESRKPVEVLPEFCHQVRMACHLFQGVTDVTMSHNEAWHFIRLGTTLERADKTTRMLDVKYFILLPAVADVGTPYDDIQWAAVLKSVSGFEMYRKRYGRISPERIVEFLLLDGEFPRAVRHCIGLADQSLHAITGTPAGAFSCVSEQRIGLLRSELDYAQSEAVIKSGLHEFFDALEAKMNRIDECILGDFFVQSFATAQGSRTAP